MNSCMWDTRYEAIKSSAVPSCTGFPRNMSKDVSRVTQPDSCRFVIATPVGDDDLRISRKGLPMKFTVIPAALAVAALAMAPAMAKSKSKYRHSGGNYAEPYHGDGWNGHGWTSRNVSDPSFGNRAGINYARRSGRCVVDLGYGRYEYCGW